MLKLSDAGVYFRELVNDMWESLLSLLEDECLSIFKSCEKGLIFEVLLLFF